MTIAALKRNQSQKRNSFPFNWLQKGLYQKSTQMGMEDQEGKTKRSESALHRFSWPGCRPEY
jgi:hypothetical protein